MWLSVERVLLRRVMEGLSRCFCLFTHVRHLWMRLFFFSHCGGGGCDAICVTAICLVVCGTRVSRRDVCLSDRKCFQLGYISKKLTVIYLHCALHTAWLKMLNIYLHMCMHIHICIQYICVHIHKYIHIYPCVFIHINIYIHIHTSI